MRTWHPLFFAAVACGLLWIGIAYLQPQLPMLLPDHLSPSGNTPSELKLQPPASLPWTGTHSMTGTGMLPNGSAVVMPSPEQYALSMDVPVVRDATFGTPRFVGLRSGFLSPSAPDAPPEAVLRAFLEANGRKFTLHASDILDPENAEKMRDVVTPHNGMRSLTWRQQHNGIEIFGAHLALNLTADNRIINVQSRALNFESLRFHDDVKVTAGEALEIAGGIDHPAFAQGYGGRGGTHGSHGKELPPPVAIWYPLDMVTVVKAWDVWVEKTADYRLQTVDIRNDGPMTETHRLIVRADTGEVVEDINLTYGLENATYNVFVDDSPTPSTPGADSPTNGVAVEVARTNVIITAVDTNASPQGWIPTGANTLLGNNAQVYADWDDNDAPDGPTITGTAYRVFDYPLSLSSGERSDYVDAAQVQAFYVINHFHDRLWQLGFDEQAGNFQNDNFGRGGIQSDRLRVEVQNDYTAHEAGSYGVSAWYTGWGDGSIGRISIICSTIPPRKDGALDAQVLIHEATHGLTSRLIGNGFGLSTTQSRGMAEGWSDFMALALLGKPSDLPVGTYPFASYVAERFMQTQHIYFGIRRFPYSTDTSKAPQTLADIDPNQIDFPPHIPIDDYYASEDADQIHNIGEVWCLVLWECRANLIERYGFAGNELIMQLVVDGMKLAPENPNFAEARDAILQADLINHGGANQADLWRGFAKRGLGYGAIVPGSVSTVGIVESYAMPFDMRWTVTETAGDGDGYVEPGESGQIRVVLESFELPLGNASGNLSLGGAAAQSVSITSSNCVFGTIASGQSATGTPVFAFSVDAAFPGNSNAWFALAVQSDQGAFDETFAVLIGNPYDYLPMIGDITVAPAMTNTVISWTTGIESGGRVDYGLTTNYLAGSVASGGTGLTHTATIVGLAPGSNYHFRITATGMNGQTNATADLTFRARSYVYARADSTVTPELGTLDAPFSSLQSAAAAAQATGDEVHVAGGTYTGTGAEGVLDLVGTAWDLTIRGGYSEDFSTNNPALYPTSLDGQQVRRGIRLDEGARLTLHDATITRGSGLWGGGVHVRMSQFTATDCVISDNASTNASNRFGGGVYGALGSLISLNHCRILNNIAGDGGGCFLVSNGTVLYSVGCVFKNNTAYFTGGGVRWELASQGNIQCGLTINNAAMIQGGGMSVAPFCKVDVAHETVSANEVLDATDPSYMGGGGIHVAGVSSKGTLIIKDTIIWGNTSNYGKDLRCDIQSDVHALYSNIGDIYGNLTTSTNLISADPKFSDPENGDFHLLYGSPCIDEGSPNEGVGVDMDGEARPSGAAMDIGADEFVDDDSDQMADTWELRYFGNIATTSGAEDTDGDGLDTFGEYVNQTDPFSSDTDGDLALDGWEVANGYDPKDQDMDGDGMWDGWEVNYGLNAFTNDAAENPDGDAHDNLSEFMADTDPHDGNSVLQILNIGQQWGGTRLDWQGGRDSYQILERCSSLVSNSWSTFFVVPPPTPIANAVIVFDEESNAFYRLRVERE